MAFHNIVKVASIPSNRTWEVIVLTYPFSFDHLFQIRTFGSCIALWYRIPDRWRGSRFTFRTHQLMGRDSSVVIAGGYGLPTVRGSNPDGGEIFRTRPDRPCGPPCLLYNGYHAFPRSKAVRAWCWPPIPFLAPRSRKVIAIPLPLWAFGSVTVYLYLYAPAYIFQATDICKSQHIIPVRNTSVQWQLAKWRKN
jgi:hypothetical protein